MAKEGVDKNEEGSVLQVIPGKIAPYGYGEETHDAKAGLKRGRAGQDRT